MKRIIFHIGTHKTATTTIQRTLSRNRETLRRQGVLYPILDRSFAPHPDKHLGLFKALLDVEAAVLAERDLLLESFENSGCETLLLSEEHLSWMDPENLRPLEHFAADYRVEAVCLLRRQDIFLESMWNQITKGGENSQSIETYCRRTRIRRRILYDQMLDGWDRFSDVTALSFDAAKAQGVMSAFCQATGLPALPETRSMNVSPSVNCALALVEIARAGLEVDRKQLMRAFQGDSSKHLLGHRLRREILDEVADSNQRLEAKYGIRFEAGLPDEQEQPVTRPDPQAIAQAIAWLSEKERQRGTGRAEGTTRGSDPVTRLRATRRLLAALYPTVSPPDDTGQETPAVPAAGKLARAIWREEIQAENLSREDRQARWQEVKKDRIQVARRVLGHLNKSGLSLVETDTGDT